jgi:hypothetical protein
MWSKRKAKEPNLRYSDNRYAANAPTLTAETTSEVLTTLAWVFDADLGAEPVSDGGALEQEWAREGGSGALFWLNWRNYSYQALHTRDPAARERVRQELRDAAVIQTLDSPHPFWQWLMSAPGGARPGGQGIQRTTPRGRAPAWASMSTADLLRQVREEQERKAQEEDQTDRSYAAMVRKQNEIAYASLVSSL